MADIINIGVFDYSNHKLCDLYDSQVKIQGQAYDIDFIQNKDGINELSFTIPYFAGDARNFRWDFLKAEYLVRLYDNGREEWFVADKPVKKKDRGSIVGTVSCQGTPILLKTKNIYMEFDDENGIGTIDYLMEQILKGTGWHLGYCEVIYEADGVTEKVRSLSSGGKKGALGLINSVCDLFQCRPVYHTDTQTVDIYGMKTRDMIFEAEVGKNLDSLQTSFSSDDIITRLYVEGEYGDHGYVGIDDVNPTGLSYLLNFDYYREIGVFTEEHEQALATYLEDIEEVVHQIRLNQQSIIVQEDIMNELVGQCKLVVYYTSQGFVVPKYIYGSPTEEQQALAVGDEVIVLNSNGTYRTETIATDAQSLIRSGDYAVAKFVTKAAGTVGAKEVQVEAKEKEIATLNRKINATIKEDKKAEYRAEIAQLQNEIDAIYEAADGLYALMERMMRPNGVLDAILGLEQQAAILYAEQDEIEATFIAAMGYMLRDGCWQNNNYIVGQEEALLADAEEHMKVMSRPEASYSFDYVRMMKEYGVPMEDIRINAIVRVNDDEVNCHENLIVSKITTGIDKKDYGKIDVTNEDLTLGSNDLGSLLSRMSQLSDLIEQKNAIYNRAEAISKSGTLFADRLNGQIDVVRTQILSSVSNWYTDPNGNMIFESADGGSAMMLSGAGFLLADSRNEDGSWNWRTSATGHGLNADEIVAGFISADRIESGSISVNHVTPNFGSTLSLSGNPSLEALSDQIAPAFDEETDYTAGQIVNYHGDIYIFTQDHPAGEWDPTDVSRTDVTTQLELLPDKIIQYVGQQGYGKTYIQLSDPTLDPNNNVTRGDYWVVAKPDGSDNTKTWQEVLDSYEFWGDVKEDKWGTLSGYIGLYCWNGTTWVSVYDANTLATAYTRVIQTQDEIRLEAERANAAEGELRGQIVLTADSITQEVRNGYTSKSFFMMTADGRIQLTASNFMSLGAENSGIYITPASISINTSGTLAINSGGSMTINSGGDMNIASGGDMNINSGGNFNLNSGGKLNIKSSGTMSVESGGNLTIKSGGKFSLTSDNFSVTTAGRITATSGTIGGFTIGATSLHGGSGSTYVNMAASDWAFTAGASTVASAPFRVNANGDVYIRRLMVRNESDTGYEPIDFTSFATQEDVAGGFAKLKYNTVVSVDTNAGTMTLSNGRSYPIG